MPKIAYLTIVLLLIMPYAHATLWENYEARHLFSTTDWYIIHHGSGYNISAGFDSWAMWNSTTVLIYRGYHLVKTIICADVEKVWVGGNYVLIKYHNGTSSFIYLENFNKRYISINIVNAILTKFGAIIISNSIYSVNLNDFSYKKFEDYIFGCVDYWRSQFLIYKNNTLLAIKNDKTLWSVSFKSYIKGVGITSDNYYVLCQGNLYILNNFHKIVGKIQSDGDHICGATHFAALEEKMIDDEGKKQWLFTVLSFEREKVNITGRHITYLPPRECIAFGDYISFYDSRTIHILNSTNHICANNTFERVVFSHSTIVGKNLTGIYALTYKDIVKSLKDLGRDNDLDWIPDSKDPDDDNDGMPDWWEEKYGLNPLDPSDRNLDLDGDGLTNYQEYLYGTNPRKWDTDGDGLSDGYEVAHGLNPLIPNVKYEFNEILVEYVIISLIVFLGIIGTLRNNNVRKNHMKP